MMQTSAVATHISRPPVTGPRLGKEEFLKLLIAQMRMQDPLQPMNDREFIAQLAQFSALEQMQNISAGLEELMRRQDESTALALVGRTVTVTTDAGGTLTGPVNSVRRENGASLIVINGAAYPVANLVEVRS